MKDNFKDLVLKWTEYYLWNVRDRQQELVVLFH